MKLFLYLLFLCTIIAGFGLNIYGEDHITDGNHHIATPDESNTDLDTACRARFHNMWHCANTLLVTPRERLDYANRCRKSLDDRCHYLLNFKPLSESEKDKLCKERINKDCPGRVIDDCNKLPVRCHKFLTTKKEDTTQNKPITNTNNSQKLDNSCEARFKKVSSCEKIAKAPPRIRNDAVINCRKNLDSECHYLINSNP